MIAPFRYKIRHRHDQLLHRGFNYHGNILYKTLSSAMFLEPKRELILAQYEKVLSFLVDTIKHIKKSYNWTVDKDEIYIN